MRQLDLGTGFGQTSITMKYNFQNFRLNLGENNVSKLNHTQVIERPEYPGELSKFQFYQFLIYNSDGYVGVQLGYFYHHIPLNYKEIIVQEWPNSSDAEIRMQPK